MKIRDIVTEDIEEIQPDVAAAIPDLTVFPNLENNDPYHQYRFGLALASAGPTEEGEETPYTNQSVYGEQLTVVARSEEEADIIRLARKLYGQDAEYEHVTSMGSTETDDVNKVSAVAKKVKNKYGV